MYVRTLAVVAVATFTFGRLQAERLGKLVSSSRIAKAFRIDAQCCKNFYQNSAVFGAVNEKSVYSYEFVFSNFFRVN